MGQRDQRSKERPQTSASRLLRLTGSHSDSSVEDNCCGQHPLAVTFGPEEDGIAGFVAVGLAVMLEHDKK